MGLNEGQKRAVEYLDGPLLVLAGPGTGKTQLLSEKVAYILKNTDTNPENILCLTFTESGAKNMRERLKTIVGKDGMKVNIGTYHAFGQDVLAQYKNYADNYDRKLDSAIDEVMQYKIIKSLQDKLNGNDILRGDKVKDIISVISEAKSANLTAEDLLEIAEKNTEDSAVLSDVISPYLQEVVPRKFKESFENAYQPIFKIIKDHETDKPILKNIERSISILARELKEAIIKAEEMASIAPLTKWRNDNFEKDSQGNYCLKDKIANKKLLSLAKIMLDYEAFLKEHGLFDFDDMIEEAAKVLKDNDGFRMTLQERYQYILLDEFQDTNPSQFEIVKQLTDYEKPMIMAVGDDDQAIYEFQGAMSSNLTDFQKHYEAEVMALTENYRSTQEILDFSHHIIEQAPDRFGDKELTAHKEAPENSQIYRYEFNSSDLEFGFIADKIAELIKSGVKQSEIAVISYKSKYFEPLLPYLKAHDEIKIAYEKRDNLFEDTRIHQLLTMARFVDELASEKKSTVQILEVLSYPFFELTMLDVLKLAAHAKAERRTIFECLLESEEPKFKAVAEEIAELIKKSYDETLTGMLWYFTTLMKIEKLDEYDRFLFYENLAALRGKLIKHFGDKALKLHDLIEMVDDYEAAEMPLNSTSPYREANEAVQILTAHKAKGLEFEYVFIISADHTAWGKGKGNNTFLSLPKNLIQIRHTGITDSERLRVLYVALTRAKKALYITNSLYDFDGKSPERLEYLEEYVKKDENGIERIVSPFLPTKNVIKVEVEKDFEKHEKDIKNWISAYIARTPDLREYYKNKMSGFKMSASALTNFVDIIYGGPQSFFERYVLGAPSGPEEWPLMLGNLMHATFEEVTKNNLSDEEAIKYYLESVDKYDAKEEDKKLLREKGIINLELDLKEFGNIIRSGLAELNFYADKIAVEGVPVTGKIDHIIVDEKNKTIEIYDYKTGGYHPEKWQTMPNLYGYMLQLEFYKMLLNNSIKYHDYKVTKGHILFVMQDKFEEVHDKVYEFNEEDEKEFMKLLRAVYHHATTLDFLDDNQLFIEANKHYTMKNVHDFIELFLAKSA
jgi:DNA helicase-2/ATP-dependent DNA helicase PcrA